MIFNSIDNQTIEFEITNYEFPDKWGEAYDSNWLMVSLKVNSKFGKWDVINPILTTFELEELIDWFYALADNHLEEGALCAFIEPCLGFKVLSNSSREFKHIRIFLSHSCTPRWMLKDHFFLDFSFNKALVDVSVKPSGEPILHVDVLANELVKHFKSLRENKDLKEDPYQTTYIKVGRRDYKKAMSILDLLCEGFQFND